MPDTPGHRVAPASKAPTLDGKPQARRRGWLGVAIGLILGVAATGTVAALILQASRAPKLKAQVLDKTPIEGMGRIRVEVVRPEAGTPARTTAQPGTIQSFERAELYSKVSGYLKTLAVDIGDQVKAGQVIAVLDVPELDKAVEQAEAALAKAQAGAKQAESRIETAKATVQVTQAQRSLARAELEASSSRLQYRRKEWERIAALAQKRAIEPKLVDEQEAQYAATVSSEHAAESGVQTAEAQILESKAKVDQAIADAETAEAQVAVAQADLDRALVYQGFAKIQSPYDGIITARNFHRGDFIRAASEGSGRPILAVARADLMRVLVQVPDRDVPYVDRGDPAKIRFDALGGATYQGKVARFSAQENEQSRTMRTEIDLPNPDGKLRDGMYGSVLITLEPGGSNLSVPSSALITRDGNEGTLYVVVDGKARQAKVHVGRDDGVATEILDGIGPDALVVTRALGALTEGTAVTADVQGTAPKP